MSEKVFRSPGFFDSEIEIQSSNNIKRGVPGGVIGTAEKGPAFVPVEVGSIQEYKTIFGKLSKDHLGSYAVNSFLENKDSLLFCRVLGAGANKTSSDIQNTENLGTVLNAGFRISGSDVGTALGTPKEIAGSNAKGRHEGSVQFIAGIHKVMDEEVFGYPIFSNNDSIGSTAGFQAVRAMIFMASGARMEILDHNQGYSAGATAGNDSAKIKSYDGSESEGIFKIAISSSMGDLFASDEKNKGVKILTASLDPSSIHYVGKILNKNPDLFSQEQHLLYADFPIQRELAEIKYDASNDSVGILSGSHLASSAGNSNLAYREVFGSFNTRYQTPRTTPFISQPFGSVEYDLFHFETISDGAAANHSFKVSISNIKRSNDKNNPYASFNVLIRDYYDDDYNPTILEQFVNCDLNPASENYIGSKIGDQKLSFNFDATEEDEKRLNVTGRFKNKSKYVRVVISSNVSDRLIPSDAIPFGFRGLPVIKTSDTLTDSSTTLPGGNNRKRLGFIANGSIVNANLPYSILPPVPLTFKQTRNPTGQSSDISGLPGDREESDSRIYWGIKTSNLPLTASTGTSVLVSNGAQGSRNGLIDSYVKMLGISKLDALVTGSYADAFNNNKFTLAKVALNNQSNSAHTLDQAIAQEFTGSAKDHIREAAYIRDSKLVSPNHTITDKNTSRRLTFLSLASADDSYYFNKFSDYLKFTNVFYGGFDGVNITDKDQRVMNDKATSTETGGKAAGGVIGYTNLNSDSSPGTGLNNALISSYNIASKIMTDPVSVNNNLLAIPGIKEPLITDRAAELTQDYSKALYIMDIPSYDYLNNRLYDDYASTPSVDKTIQRFEARSVDNSYVATYFPDVIKRHRQDDGGTLTVPASVAAYQAIAFNDKITHPWFAPAGFNRGGLNNILNTKIRLNTEDRNVLYEARINPIATFSGNNFVIFGQKTLQKQKSALDRVNVRRMLLEVKRIVSKVANNIIFEQNNKETRNRFISNITPQLSLIQAQQGIEQFRIIMNETNNTQIDIENNRLNGKIVLVPTRAVEFIAIDFIITNSGVSFE